MTVSGCVLKAKTKGRLLLLGLIQGESGFQGLGHEANSFASNCPWLTLTFSFFTLIPQKPEEKRVFTLKLLTTSGRVQDQLCRGCSKMRWAKLGGVSLRRGSNHSWNVNSLPLAWPITPEAQQWLFVPATPALDQLQRRVIIHQHRDHNKSSQHLLHASCGQALCSALCSQQLPQLCPP